MVPLLSLSLLAGFVVDHVGYGDDPKQQIDVTHPIVVAGGSAAAPIVIFLHGGVWQMGDRADSRHVGEALAARGILTVTASYRLAPRHRWPAQIEDAAAIVALVKKRATSWGADPGRIVLVGHSAGGHLATLLLHDAAVLGRHGLSRADIAGVVAISGVFDLRAALDEGQDDGGFARFVAPVFGTDVAVLRAASPIDVVAATGIPQLFITGTADYRAMQAQTAEMVRTMALRGEKVPVVVVDGADHFGLVANIGEPRDPVTDAIVAFVGRLPARKP